MQDKDFLDRDRVLDNPMDRKATMPRDNPMVDRDSLGSTDKARSLPNPRPTLFLSRATTTIPATATANLLNTSPSRASLGLMRSLYDWGLSGRFTPY